MCGLGQSSDKCTYDSHAYDSHTYDALITYLCGRRPELRQVHRRPGWQRAVNVGRENTPPPHAPSTAATAVIATTAIATTAAVPITATAASFGLGFFFFKQRCH